MSKFVTPDQGKSIHFGKDAKGLIISFILLDLEDLKDFSKKQGASEADDLNHWDISFWSERLRESKYDINEVRSPWSSRLVQI